MNRYDDPSIADSGVFTGKSISTSPARRSLSMAFSVVMGTVFCLFTVFCTPSAQLSGIMNTFDPSRMPISARRNSYRIPSD